MNNRQVAKWERIRSKGFWRFVLLYGVLGFGGVSLLLLVFTDHIIRSRDIDASDIVFIVVSRAVGGFIIGLCFWLFGERAYNRHPSRRLSS